MKNKKVVVGSIIGCSVLLLGLGLGLGLTFGLKSCNSNGISFLSIGNKTNLKGKYLILNKDENIWPKLGFHEEDAMAYGRVKSLQNINEGFYIYAIGEDSYFFNYKTPNDDIPIVEYNNGTFDWKYSEPYIEIKTDTSNWCWTVTSSSFRTCMAAQMISDKKPN